MIMMILMILCFIFINFLILKIIQNLMIIQKCMIFIILKNHPQNGSEIVLKIRSYINVPNAGNIKKRLSLLTGGTNLPRFERYYWSPGLWRGHIREYVYNDLINLSNFLDLDVELIDGCDHMLENVPPWLIPLYKFVTRFFPKWKDSWVLVARKKPEWSPLLTQEN